MATQKGKHWSAKFERRMRRDPYGLEEEASDDNQGWSPGMPERRLRDAGFRGADDWREAKPAEHTK